MYPVSRKMRQLAFAVSLILVTGAAQAGMMFEPYVHYDSGTLSATTTSSTDESAKNTGTSYGARLGYRFMSPVFVAAEYEMASGTSKPNASGGTNSDYTATSVGALVGFYHERFQAFLGYGMTDDLTLKGTGGNPDSKFYGTNLKVGFEYMVYHHIAIEAEYYMPNYTKVDPGTGKVDVSSLFSKFTPTAIRVGLSFPFDFMGK